MTQIKISARSAGDNFLSTILSISWSTNNLLVCFLYVNMDSWIDVRVNADRYSVRVPPDKRNNTSRFQLRFWIFCHDEISILFSRVPYQNDISLTWIYFISNARFFIYIKIHHFWKVSLHTNHSSPNKTNWRIIHLFCRGKELNGALFQVG